MSNASLWAALQQSALVGAERLAVPAIFSQAVDAGAAPTQQAMQAALLLPAESVSVQVLRASAVAAVLERAGWVPGTLVKQSAAAPMPLPAAESRPAPRSERLVQLLRQAQEAHATELLALALAGLDEARLRLPHALLVAALLLWSVCGLRASAFLADALPPGLEGRDLRVTGVVATQLVKAGQAVQAGQPLLSLLPGDGGLEAELLVPSRAIAFIEPGDRVLLRYQAYPYQKFGHQHGTVERISRSALGAAEAGGSIGNGPQGEPLYRVTVALAAQAVTAYGRPEPLKPGMLLDADILGERRRLIEWVFEPLYSLKGRVGDG